MGNLQQIFLVIILAVLLGGCATATTEQRQTVLNSLKLVGQKTTLKESSKNRKALKAGQWVTLLIDRKTGNKDLILRTIKVIEIEGDLTKIEVDTQSALEGGTIAVEGYVIKDYPRNPLFEYSRRQLQGAINAMSFKRVIKKSHDKEQEDWPEPLLVFSKNWIEKIFMTGFVAENAKRNSAPCANDYLDAKLCHSYAFQFNILNFDSEGDVQMHSEVPIVGFVQAQDQNHSYNVVAFGEDSATPKLKF